MTQQPWPQQGQQFPGQQPQPGYAPVQQQPMPGYGQPQQGFPAQQPPAQAQNPWGGQQAPQQPAQEAGPAIEHADSFDDFFSGSGEKIPGFDFGATQNGGDKMIGSSIVGTITEMAKIPQRDYADSGKILYWEPRNETETRRPRMQISITLQTDLRNWAGVKPKLIPVDPATQQPYPPEHDDGKRRVYVKEFSDLNRAINVASSAAGQKPRVGGKLAVMVRGFEPTQKGNDKVLYEAQYLPAPEKVATDSFFEQPAPAQVAPVQQQAYQPQAAPQQAGWAQQAGQPPAPQQGFPQAAGPGAPQAYAGQDAAQPAFQQGGYPGQPEGTPAPVEQAPQQNPSTLGNGQAPTQAPDWAQPQGQGYAPTGQPPVQYDAPPY